MKNRIYLSLSVILMAAILFSCNNKKYENTTEVFRDGSCQRTISLMVDSTDLDKQVFPILLNSSWKKTSTFKYKEGNSPTTRLFGDTIQTKVYDKNALFQITASKKFKKVEDMNFEKLNDSLNWSKLDRSYKLDKKFKWFYSYLTYKETDKKMNPYDLIPITDYIARDELLLYTGEYTEYLAGRDSAEIEQIKKQIEDKFEAWLRASIYEEFIQTLSQNVKLLGNPAINPETIKNKKDTINSSLKLRMKKNDEFMFQIDSVLTVCSICFDNMSFDKIRPSNSKVFDEYLKKQKQFELWLDIIVSADSEKNSVIMPGILINTNCKTVIGNKIQWEFTPLKCFFNDYEVYVTSRTTNIWAFVVSGGFLVLLIFGLVAGSLVKRRR